MKEIRSLNKDITTDTPVALTGNCLEQVTFQNNAITPILELSNTNTNEKQVEYIHDEEIYEFCKELDVAVESIESQIVFDSVERMNEDRAEPEVDQNNKLETKLIGNMQCSFRVSNRFEKEQEYKCDICSKTFTNLKNLNNHMNLHQDLKPFKCPHCNLRYRSNANIARHVKIVHNRNASFECQQCDYKCISSYQLRKHMLTHTDERKYKCDICCFMTKTKMDLKQHLKVHTGEKPYKCNVCLENFSQRIQLGRHMKNMHEDLLFKCDKCPSTFITEDKLSDHIKLHGRKDMFHCDKCHSVFSTENLLRKHNKSHALFHCNKCPASFKKEFNLKAHFVSQHQSEGVACSACFEVFPDRCTLKRHRKICKSTKKTMEHCLQCDSAFLTIAELKVHVREKHPQHNNIQCEYCDYTTWCQRYLRYHMASKHRNKKFRCEHCIFETWVQERFDQHQSIYHVPENIMPDDSVDENNKAQLKRKRNSSGEMVRTKNPRQEKSGPKHINGIDKKSPVKKFIIPDVNKNPSSECEVVTICEEKAKDSCIEGGKMDTVINDSNITRSTENKIETNNSIDNERDLDSDETDTEDEESCDRKKGCHNNSEIESDNDTSEEMDANIDKVNEKCPAKISGAKGQVEYYRNESKTCSNTSIQKHIPRDNEKLETKQINTNLNQKLCIKTSEDVKNENFKKTLKMDEICNKSKWKVDDKHRECGESSVSHNNERNDSERIEKSLGQKTDKERCNGERKKLDDCCDFSENTDRKEQSGMEVDSDAEINDEKRPIRRSRLDPAKPESAENVIDVKGRVITVNSQDIITNKSALIERISNMSDTGGILIQVLDATYTDSSDENEDLNDETQPPFVIYDPVESRNNLAFSCFRT